MSGDTFRAFSHYVIEEQADLNIETFDYFASKARQRVERLTIFISAGFLEECYTKKSFISFLQNVDISDHCCKANLIIHNGDKIPDQAYMNLLGNIFHKVYCVNIVKPWNNIFSLPIGIENLHHLKNGLVSSYLHNKSKYFPMPPPSKVNIVYSSFNISTNPIERGKLKELLLNSKYIIKLKKLSPNAYQREIHSSYFTLSPPGNGPDCHRTWEAIYLDTVPIVLSGSLDPDICRALPIMSVNSWDEFFQYSRDELLQVYTTLTSERSKEAAYMPYWIEHFKN